MIKTIINYRYNDNDKDDNQHDNNNVCMPAGSKKACGIHN